MKLTSTQFEKIVKSPIADMTAILVYGTDSGLIRERIVALLSVNVISEFSLSVINFNHIRSDQNKFEQECRSIPFGGGRKIIHLINMPITLPKFIEEIFENIHDILIIIEASELPPSSSLRKYFENAKNNAIIACYNDSMNDVIKLINQFFSDKSYTISQEALSYLAENLLGDRLLIRNELDKLVNYLGDQKNCELIDAQKICGDIFEQDINDFINHMCDSEKLKMLEILRRIVKNNIPIINLIRSSIKYLIQLYHLHVLMAQHNHTVNIAVKQLKPPIFFKQLPFVYRHIRKWNIMNIKKALDQLAILESNIKGSISYTQLKAEKKFLQISDIIK